MLFDTHCHLMDDQFAQDLDAVVERAQSNGVRRIVVPGIDVATSERAIEIASQYEGVYAAVGIHPEAAKDVPPGAYDAIKALTAHPKVVAIGEIGLDYYWDAAPRDEQQQVMATQIEIAKEIGLPVIIHNRDATKDTVDLLRSTGAAAVRGIMHCFTGSYETAVECINMGFNISFGGPATFKNAKNVHAVVPRIPDEALLIETDAPYLAPHPNRGKRNEPAYVRIVAERLAELRASSLEDIAALTYQNAINLFGNVVG